MLCVGELNDLMGLMIRTLDVLLPKITEFIFIRDALKCLC